MRRICKRRRQASSLRDFVALACSDITAYVLIFHENDKFQLVPFFWIPEEKMLEKIRKENINYDLWVKAGYVKVTSENVLDYDFV